MKFNKKMFIENSVISENSKIFIIAEAGVNHNGDIKLAKELIDTAYEAKVDAVKFQSFRTERLILPEVIKAPYQLKTANSDTTQFEMLKKLEISKQQNKELKDYCKLKGIIFLTTPFDEESLDELDELYLPAYKIASTDTTNLPFLKKVAKKGKPVLLSTGMTYLSEIEMALQEIYPYNRDVVLLQCSANYPIPDKDANLAIINTFKEKFDILVGYSDHTAGIGAAPFAVPLGVKVIEKHFTLDKSQDGPDHKASLSPEELSEFVRQIRRVEEYLGSAIKMPSFTEIQTRKTLQKCLVANCKIGIREKFSENNIVAKRTGGNGVLPLYYKNLLGKKSNKNYIKDDIIDE